MASCKDTEAYERKHVGYLDHDIVTKMLIVYENRQLDDKKVRHAIFHDCARS